MLVHRRRRLAPLLLAALLLAPSHTWAGSILISNDSDPALPILLLSTTTPGNVQAVPGVSSGFAYDPATGNVYINDAQNFQISQTHIGDLSQQMPLFGYGSTLLDMAWKDSGTDAGLWAVDSFGGGLANFDTSPASPTFGMQLGFMALNYEANGIAWHGEELWVSQARYFDSADPEIPHFGPLHRYVPDGLGGWTETTLLISEFQPGGLAWDESADLLWVGTSGAAYPVSLLGDGAAVTGYQLGSPVIVADGRFVGSLASLPTEPAPEPVTGLLVGGALAVLFVRRRQGSKPA